MTTHAGLFELHDKAPCPDATRSLEALNIPNPKNPKPVQAVETSLALLGEARRRLWYLPCAQAPKLKTPKRGRVIFRSENELWGLIKLY